MNDKKIINACLWFFALCVGVILITSCSPEVEKAFGSLQALHIFAEGGVTEKGKPHVIRARNRLNKFLKIKK